MNAKQGKNVFSSFRTLLRGYNDFVTACTGEYELSPNEAAVLSELQKATTASAIAKSLDVSKALVSRSVKALKEKGLIEIAISETDKREQNLRLTESGLKIAGLIDDAETRFYEIVSEGSEARGINFMELTLKLFIKNLNTRGGQ